MYVIGVHVTRAWIRVSFSLSYIQRIALRIYRPNDSRKIHSTCRVQGRSTESSKGQIVINNTNDGNESQYVHVGRKLMAVPPGVADASESLPPLPGPEHTCNRWSTRRGSAVEVFRTRTASLCVRFSRLVPLTASSTSPFCEKRTCHDNFTKIASICCWLSHWVNSSISDRTSSGYNLMQREGLYAYIGNMPLLTNFRLHFIEREYRTWTASGAEAAVFGMQ